MDIPANNPNERREAAGKGIMTLLIVELSRLTTLILLLCFVFTGDWSAWDWNSYVSESGSNDPVVFFWDGVAKTFLGISGIIKLIVVWIAVPQLFIIPRQVRDRIILREEKGDAGAYKALQLLIWLVLLAVSSTILFYVINWFVIKG